jgi:sigma-B regulation protein RsbU (phosphoserine phosphatase)
MNSPQDADEVDFAEWFDEDPQRLYDRAPCGYVSTTPDGTIVKVNQTLLSWTGYQREELLGRRTFASLLTAGGRIYHDTHYGPMLRLQDSVREIAFEIVRADASRLPVLVNAALERTPDGVPVVVRVVIFDATERREYERELLRAKKAAEESERRARRLAHTLQQTLIPPTPPEIPGLQVSAAYRPAGGGEEVGGDFYDVFQIGEDDWVVALGDVCGKGVDAAIVTALVRHTLRAVTVRFDDPVEGLEALNDVLLRHETDRFCTVALLRLRRNASGSGWRVSLSLGGHPAPLRRAPNGRTQPLGMPGMLVGAFPNAHFALTQMGLDRGDAVVLYTDGVTEGRRGDEMYGEPRLRRIVEENGPAELTHAILDDVLTFQGGRPRDDIAVVTISVPPHAGRSAG